MSLIVIFFVFLNLIYTIQYDRKRHLSNDLGKNIQLISCTILLRLVALNTSGALCSGGACV